MYSTHFHFKLTLFIEIVRKLSPRLSKMIHDKNSEGKYKKKFLYKQDTKYNPQICTTGSTVLEQKYFGIEKDKSSTILN